MFCICATLLTAPKHARGNFEETSKQNRDNLKAALEQTRGGLEATSKQLRGSPEATSSQPRGNPESTKAPPKAKPPQTKQPMVHITYDSLIPKARLGDNSQETSSWYWFPSPSCDQTLLCFHLCSRCGWVEVFDSSFALAPNFVHVHPCFRKGANFGIADGRRFQNIGT